MMWRSYLTAMLVACLVTLTNLAGCIPPIPVPQFTPSIPPIDIPQFTPVIPTFPPGPVPTPSLPVNMPVTISFEVSLPATNQPVLLNLQGREYKMTPVTDYLFTGPPMELKTGDFVEYFFSDGSKSTRKLTLRVEREGVVRDGLPWVSSPVVDKPGFIMGHTVMDAGGFIIQATRDGSIQQTMDAMKEDAGQWFGYDYYWAYGDYSRPEILDETTMNLELRGDKPARPDDIRLMATQAHEKGLKFFLITELEWQVTPEEMTQIGSEWDAYFKYLNEKWSKGQDYIALMGDRLRDTPNDPEVRGWWNRWFDQFGRFMLHSAKIAEESHIEMMAVGKQVIPAMQPALEPQWRELITEVRRVYSGKLCQVLWVNNWSDPGDVPWASELDYVVLYPWHNYSDSDKPGLTALEKAISKFNAEQFKVYFDLYKIPVVLLPAFQSRDHAAQQNWFEPMASSPNVSQDFVAQSDLYEAMFRATLNEPWLGGVISWGYWIEADFKEKYSFNKSSSIRSKPASLVFRKWASLVRS